MTLISNSLRVLSFKELKLSESTQCENRQLFVVTTISYTVIFLRYIALVMVLLLIMQG